MPLCHPDVKSCSWGMTSWGTYAVVLKSRGSIRPPPHPSSLESRERSKRSDEGPREAPPGPTAETPVYENGFISVTGVADLKLAVHFLPRDSDLAILGEDKVIPGPIRPTNPCPGHAATGRKGLEPGSLQLRRKPSTVPVRKTLLLLSPQGQALLPHFPHCLFRPD